MEYEEDEADGEEEEEENDKDNEKERRENNKGFPRDTHTLGQRLHPSLLAFVSQMHA